MSLELFRQAMPFFIVEAGTNECACPIHVVGTSNRQVLRARIETVHKAAIAKGACTDLIEEGSCTHIRIAWDAEPKLEQGITLNLTLVGKMVSLWGHSRKCDRALHLLHLLIQSVVTSCRCHVGAMDVQDPRQFLRASSKRRRDPDARSFLMRQMVLRQKKRKGS